MLSGTGQWCRGKQVALDSARGLAYLHRKRIAWLDCKSSNVLLTKCAPLVLSHAAHVFRALKFGKVALHAYSWTEGPACRSSSLQRHDSC